MASKIPFKKINVESAEIDYFGSKDDHAEGRSVSSRERVRDQLKQQIEDFVARGGQISEVAPHVTADPPKKPNSSYGSRPI